MSSPRSTPAMRLGPGSVVRQPTQETPDVGLTSFGNVTTTPPEGQGEDRWTLGYVYRADRPHHVQIHSATNWNEVGSNIVDPTKFGPEIIDTVPVVLTVEDEISTVSRDTRDVQEFVEQMLEDYTSKMLEHELWTGELAEAESYPNRRLDGPDTISVSGGDVRRSIAHLAQALSESGPGGGMIHVPMFIALMMPDGIMTGNIKEKFGVDIVPGSGYPSDSLKIYGTQRVNVRLSTKWTIPDDLSEAVDPRKNTLRYRAERFGAVDFAGPVFSSQVSL